MPDSITSSIRSIMFMAAMTLVTDLIAQEPEYTVKVTTDREDALYEVGEQATFTITVWNGDEQFSGEGTLTYQMNDYLIPQGKVTAGAEPTTVIHGLKEPGFLRCIATFTPKDGKPVKQTGREVSVCKLQCFGEELLVPSGALSLSLEAVGGGMMP
jgi:hypothetical protein